MGHGVLASSTAALAGALLFAVEPLVARQLVPALGGSAQVWAACVLFFQLAVLAGTGLALFTARLSRGAQRAIHVALALAGIASLPPVASAAGEGVPAGADPTLWLLVRLAARIGAPVVALCATSSLVLQWEPDRRRASAAYAASNAGSLAGLLAYPFLVEPALGLARQGRAWSAGYALFAALLVALATRRGATAVATAEPASGAARLVEQAAQEVEDLDRPDPEPLAGPWAWALAAAVPASLSLSVSAHLAHEVPAAPVFWVVPLAVYLIGFILAFGGPRGAVRELARALEPLLIAVLCLELWVPVRLAGFALHLSVLFAVSLNAHGRLADSAPEPAGRAGFALAVAAGGAMGGLFNALVAPAVFPAALEYPLALVLACQLRPGPRAGVADLRGPLLLLVATAGVLFALPHAGDERDVVARVSLLFVAAAVALTFRARPVRLALGVAAVLACAFGAFQLDGAVLLARSPYGVSRVTREPGRTLLWHGSTIHGGAADHPDGRPRPIAYHAPESPLGRLLARPGPARRVAVVGLGAGALAWHARPGDAFTFYELDPVVVEIARDPRTFRFLSTCRGAVDVVPGDGRLALAAETRTFDTIVLDAFTSDAVPVHLLTVEALAIYRARLAPGGAIVFNTSNRHADLPGLVTALGASAGLAVRVTPGPDEEPAAAWHGTFAAVGPGAPATWRLAPSTRVEPWTDDRASLWPVLRF